MSSTGGKPLAAAEPAREVGPQPGPPATIVWTFVFFALLMCGALWLRDRSLDALTGVLDGRTARATPLAGPGFAPPPGTTAAAEETPPPLPPAWHPGAHATFTGQKIEDSCQDASCKHPMDAFYGALARVQNKDKGAIARIAHYGDSITANDEVTARARIRMQTQFGDAGAGFVYLATANRFAHHLGTDHKNSPGWQVRSVVATATADKLYGLGAASFEAHGGDNTATFTTLKKGDVGKAVSHYDIYYLEQPGGGSFELDVDGKSEATVDTAGTAPKAAFKSIDVPDGPHRLVVKTLNGKVRGYGVVMERASGVVYDNLGLISGTAKALRSVNPVHFGVELEHRSPDLIIVFYGANEADFLGAGKKTMIEYASQFTGMLAQIKGARPEASCLVMSPLDAATVVDNKFVTKPAIPGLVEAQKASALASGCAFWNAYEYMGGKGSIGKWFHKGMFEPDLTHPNRSGASKIGDALVDAILAGFDDYLARRGGK